MKVIIENAPEALTTEDLNVHFSALGECSITRSVPLTQTSKVTVTYPDFSTALQTLLSLHFAPLLKVPKLTFAVECSIDVPMQAEEQRVDSDAKDSETQVGSATNSDEKKPENHEKERSRSRSPRTKDAGEQSEQDLQQVEKLNAEEKKSEETKPGEDGVTEKKEEEKKSLDGEKKYCKKRGKKGSPVGKPKNIHVESDGSQFQIIRKYKDDDMTQLQCLSCKRKVLKRSVESHVSSATHKRNFSRHSK